MPETMEAARAEPTHIPEAPGRSEALGLSCLGTAHNDPSGYRRLKLWLEVLQPDLILVELSPFGRRFRKRKQRRYQRALLESLRRAAQIAGIPYRQALTHPEIDAIRRQIAYPFEYRAARSYASSRKISLVLVDHSPFSMHCTLRWPELITDQNLVHLLDLPPRRPSVASEYRLAREILSGRKEMPFSGIARSAEEGPGLWQARERSMAARIRRCLHAAQALNPVFIGGWHHLTSGGGRITLAALLPLARARCRLVCDPPSPTGD